MSCSLVYPCYNKIILLKFPIFHRFLKLSCPTVSLPKVILTYRYCRKKPPNSSSSFLVISLKLRNLTLSWRRSLSYGNQFINSVNQWAGFHMIVNSVMKELSNPPILRNLDNFPLGTFYLPSPPLPPIQLGTNNK